ncbi:hypothetical protein [Salinisphaera sp. Q1T1-3]|uniref:hypothetical protein n=1 Tax=Salinisphaera sp. Q1T1-3 TaxID=2321229 RepID=UPI000E748AEB|nr:hypothetical protein [Salinisphaera sp. Q1T1-3]RJS95241.1 hypothetical protein D3260_01410 [Salinisphaera sp. Q1T1-3]
MAEYDDTIAPVPLPRRHATRLRHYWRSQGWACHDNIDLDLLRWGLIVEYPEREIASRFELSAGGRDALTAGLQANRAARAAHARSVAATARHLVDGGRLVFTELSIRTIHEDKWRTCRPDVLSLVPGLRADHLVPQVHEIKVRRSDLLGELRHAKIERYRELAAGIYFVLADDIADVSEIPDAYGVAFHHPNHGYRIARSAPIGDYQLETRHWMALAKARPFAEPPPESPQLAF